MQNQTVLPAEGFEPSGWGWTRWAAHYFTGSQ